MVYASVICNVCDTPAARKISAEPQGTQLMTIPVVGESGYPSIPGEGE